MIVAAFEIGTTSSVASSSEHRSSRQPPIAEAPSDTSPAFDQRLRVRFQAELHRLLRNHAGRWAVVSDEGILATSFDRDQLFRTYYFSYELPFLILRIEPSPSNSSDLSSHL